MSAKRSTSRRLRPWRSVSGVLSRAAARASRGRGEHDRAGLQHRLLGQVRIAPLQGVGQDVERQRELRRAPAPRRGARGPRDSPAAARWPPRAPTLLRRARPGIETARCRRRGAGGWPRARRRWPPATRRSGPPPSSSAAPMASATTTAICHVPVPITKTSRSATRIPSATPNGHLHRAPPAPAEAQAQGHHRGDGGEEGASVAEHLRGHHPGEGRRHGGVEDRPRAHEDRLAPSLQPGAGAGRGLGPQLLSR